MKYLLITLIFCANYCFGMYKNTYSAVIAADAGQFRQFLYNDGNGRQDLNDRETWCKIAPLHIAAENDKLEHADLLLEYGAELFITDSDGNTPLHGAVKENKKIMSGLLLLHADRKKQLLLALHTKNDDGHIPADLAQDEALQKMLDPSDWRNPLPLITDYDRMQFDKARGNKSAIQFVIEREYGSNVPI